MSVFSRDWKVPKKSSGEVRLVRAPASTSLAGKTRTIVRLVRAERTRLPRHHVGPTHNLCDVSSRRKISEQMRDHSVICPSHTVNTSATKKLSTRSDGGHGGTGTATHHRDRSCGYTSGASVRTRQDSGGTGGIIRTSCAELTS